MTPSVFAALGVAPLMGRVFTVGNGDIGAPADGEGRDCFA